MLDLHFQEYPLRCSTYRRFTLGQTSSSTERDGNTRWFLRTNMQTGAYQGASIVRAWRQFALWGGRQSISGWHTNTQLQGC